LTSCFVLFFEANGMLNSISSKVKLKKLNLHQNDVDEDELLP